MNTTLMITLNTTLADILTIRQSPEVLYIGINPMFFFGILFVLVASYVYRKVRELDTRPLQKYLNNLNTQVRHRTAALRS